MPASHSNVRRPAALGDHPRRCSSRRGAVALLAIWVLVIFLSFAAWVLNYNYLVLVNRNMQQKSDAIALAAAPALLDEDLLRDYPEPPLADPTDDLAEARALADQYRRLNNQVQSPALRLNEDDVTVKSCDGDATLRVFCRRLATGNHPVHGLLGLLGGGSQSVDVQISSSATLDAWLIGFRPTATALSPVMPLAIDAAAWADERPLGGDVNGNGIREMVLRLDSPNDDPATDANAALVFYDGTPDPGVLGRQISEGLAPGDLPPGGVLGPVSAAAPRWTTAVGQVDAAADPGLSDDLAEQINQLAAGDARRVFPLFDATADLDQPVGEVRLVGFVAAKVLAAAAEDDRLIVLVEPCFLIHATCWTTPAGDPAAPTRNTYIHKLRLTQ